jgi:hypothetical protein
MPKITEKVRVETIKKHFFFDTTYLARRQSEMVYQLVLLETFFDFSWRTGAH